MGFYLYHDTIYLLPLQGSVKFLLSLPPSLAFHWQSIFYSLPLYSIGDDWPPLPFLLRTMIFLRPKKNPSPPQAIKTTLPWGKFFKGFDVATNDKKFPRTIKVCRFCASLIENVLILWIPASHVSRVETGHLLTKVNFIFLPLSSKREIIIWCALASSNVSICNVGCYFNSCLWQPFYRDWYFQILQIFNCEVQQ